MVWSGWVIWREGEGGELGLFDLGLGEFVGILGC